MAENDLMSTAPPPPPPGEPEPNPDAAARQTPPPPTGMPNAPGPGLAPPAVFPDGRPMSDPMGRPISARNRTLTLVLCLLGWIIGIAGIHRFYCGKIGTGILMLVTLGGLGIWTLIDVIMIAVGSFKDKEERWVLNW
mgnify:CR=1 FL=1